MTTRCDGRQRLGFLSWARSISARLTPAAYQHGLALALPEAVMAHPEGFERSSPTIVTEDVEELVEALLAA